MKPFPKCISTCDLDDCVRKLDGDETKLVDYAKVNEGRCKWHIPIVKEVTSENNVEDSLGE